MGHITKEAYDYWSKKQDKLGEYLAEYRDMNMLLPFIIRFDGSNVYITLNENPYCI